MASNISKIPKNMLSNPNLDAADTGVDPSTGRYLTKRERSGIFKRRRIKASNIFGRTSPNLAKVGKIGKPLAKFGSIVKVDDENIGDDAPGGVEPKDKLISGLMKQVENNSKKITILKNIVKLNIQKVSKILVGDAEKEKKDQREDLRQQKMDDEKDKKKKKEGLLEGIGKSVGKSLLKPVEAVGKSVKGILGRLGDAFMALFAGFVANKAIKMIQAHMSGDTETFKQMRNTIIKSVAVVGGIFLILNGGLLALPGIISGIITTVISLGGAMMAFMASPAGLIALGIAAGIGVLFAVKKSRKDVDAALDSNKQNLRDAGIKAYKKDGARVMRNGKEVFVKTENLTEGERSAREAFEIEQQRIKNVTKDKNKTIRGTFDRVTKERESMDNPEWAKIMAVKDLKKRKKLIKEFRKETQQIVNAEKKSLRKEAKANYSGSTGDISPKIDSNTKNNNVKINSNSKKNGVTNLEEPKTQVIDTTTTSGGGGGGTSGSGKAASGLPNISSSNRDNNHVVYSQTQFNIIGV